MYVVYVVVQLYYLYQMVTCREEGAHREAKRDDGQRIRDQEEEQHRWFGVTHDGRVVRLHFQDAVV